MSIQGESRIEELGKEWQRHYQELRAAARVLVVDDEPVVYEVVEQILSMAGLQIEVAGTAEMAWERIQQRNYALLITDKNLPGITGIELIARIRAAGIELPSLVITGYASVESIADALAAGAADYITKPFDDIEQVQRRAMAVIERNLLIRLYARMVRDLMQVVAQAGGGDKERVQRIGAELFAFKRDLGTCPDLVLVAPPGEQRSAIAEALGRAGFSIRSENDPRTVVALVSEPHGPLAAVVSLQLHFPVALIAELISHDPLLNVVAISSSPRLADALAAVRAGAADIFLLAVERFEALEARVRRVVAKSRRDRLYLQLIAILHRESAARGKPLMDGVLALLPENHREYLARATVVSPELALEVEVDLSDLFAEAEAAGERRRFQRTAAAMVEAWYRLEGSSAAFSRGRLRDISRGGFFLYTDQTIQNGTALEAHLLLRGDAPDAAVRVRGKVVRTEVFDPDPDKLSGIGVLVAEQFQDLQGSLIDRLAGSEVGEGWGGEP